MLAVVTTWGKLLAKFRTGRCGVDAVNHELTRPASDTLTSLSAGTRGLNFWVIHKQRLTGNQTKAVGTKARYCTIGDTSISLDFYLEPLCNLPHT